MPGFLTGVFGDFAIGAPLEIAARLVIALLLGGVVAWTYVRTRPPTEISPSFPTTLVLLAVLIAMVTQVIGDNIARAFSLVGALSIVRFRTVVRDTQDTAFVIFAVAVGMAVGAGAPWVALAGIVVVGIAAFAMMKIRPSAAFSAAPTFVLSLRVGLGSDPDELLGRVLDEHLVSRRMLSIGTARQGVSLDLTYETQLRPERSPNEFVKALNRIEGVQSVEFQRRTTIED